MSAINLTAEPPRIQQMPAGWLRWSWLVVLALAGTTGAAAFALGELETRWLVFALAGAIGLLILLVVPYKDRLLSTAFVLSLQADVYLRLSYGRAGSIDGIAVSFTVVLGAVWLIYRYFAFGPAYLRTYRLGGLAVKPMLGILAITLVSLATTDERFVGLTRLVFELQLFFVYWLTFNLVRSEHDFKRLLGLLLAALIIQSIVLYVQNALGINFSMIGEVSQRGEVPRPGGTVGTTPAGFSSFITPALMMSIAYAFARSSDWRPRAALLAALLGLAAIGLTFTRAAWAGAILGMATVVILLARRRMARWNRIFAIAAILGLAAAALLPTMMQRLSQDYGAHVNAQSAAWEERWGLMRIAFNMIVHNPITGVGPGAYLYTFKSYIPPGLHQWVYVVHNEFLLRAAETGVPGLLAFIALIVVGFRLGARLARSPRPTLVVAGFGWTGALLSLVWQMSWVPWNGFTFNSMLWCMLGLLDATCSFERGTGASRDARPRLPGSTSTPPRNSRLS